MPITKKELNGPDPWKMAKKKEKLDCNWLAKIIKETGDKKEKSEVRLKSGGLFARIDGLDRERVELSGPGGSPLFDNLASRLTNALSQSQKSGKKKK
jgi:hypothetical protein